MGTHKKTRAEQQPERPQKHIVPFEVEFTKQKGLEKLLHTEQDRSKIIYEHINFGISLISPDMRILDMNSKMREWFPHVDVEQRPYCYDSFNTPPRGKVCSYCPTIKAFQKGEIHTEDTETPTPDGIRNYRITAIPMKDDNGNVYAVMELVEEITERKKDREQLKQQIDELSKSEKFLNTIFESINDPFNILDRDYRIIKANESYARMRGKTIKQLIGKRCYEILQNRNSPCEGCSVKETFDSGKPLTKEKLASFPDGSYAWVEIYTYPIFDEKGNVSNVIEYTRDITKRKKAEAERDILVDKLHYLSRTDELTGLLNRRALIEKLEDEVRRTQRYKKNLSILICDIDYFKEINDANGHDIGDRVLQVVSNLLKESLRSTDVIGRYGGDEFLLILPETSMKGAKKIAERIRLTIENFKLQIGGKEPIKTSVSLGIAEFNVDKEDINDLIKRADNALYMAKGRGKNRVYIIGN